jgi:hypothetical protein
MPKKAVPKKEEGSAEAAVPTDRRADVGPTAEPRMSQGSAKVAPVTRRQRSGNNLAITWQ